MTMTSRTRSTASLRRALVPLAMLSALGTMASAHAQSCDPIFLLSPPKADTSGAGYGGGVLMSGGDCYGSGAQRTELLPVLNYRWNNGFFVGTTYGAGYAFQSAEYLQYGVRITADLGRKSKHSPVLAGMPDVDASLEAGAFLNVFFSRQVFVTSALRYGSGNDHRGLRLDLRAHYINHFAPQWRLALALATTAANRDYMQNYFGVTAAQATAERPEFTPGAGTRDVRGIVALTHFITPEWDATLSLTSIALQGDAKHSPIVRDRTPLNAMLAVTRDF